MNSPSQQCKAAGLPSLAYVCKVAQVHPDTATRWFHNKPSLFRVVVAGVKAIDEQEKGDE